MKLIQLRYFVSIVETGGFIAASRELSVAQPALSRQISELEAELDRQLLNRGRQGVSMTNAGRRFYEHARSILEQVEIARSETRNDSGSAIGNVRVALQVGAAGLIGPKLVQRMAADYPDVLITIVDGLGYQSGKAIETGNVDLGVVPNAESLTGAVFEPILDEHLFCVLPPQGSDRDTSDIPLRHVERLNLVMPSRTVHVRRHVENVVARTGRSLNVRYEQQSMITILALVQAGVGATILGWPPIHALWQDGKLDARRIVRPEISRVISLARPANRPLSSAAQATQETLRSLLISEVKADTWKGTLI